MIDDGTPGRPPGDRGRRMEARVLRSAADRGVLPAGLDLVARALRSAMELRDEPRALPSDQDPAYLHPGRVVLILLQDVEETRPGLLAAGALSETRHPYLRPSLSVAERLLDPTALAWWQALPAIDWSAEGGTADGELVESLVTADEEVRYVALCEALDQLRHAHLWEHPGERARAADIARQVLGPIAAREHARLERRFDWWIRRVGNSLRFERK